MDNLVGHFGGMRVIESIYATETVSVRKHKLTKSQIKHLEKHMFKGITYHDRIQKKWNKRFGFKQVPGMMIVDPTVVGVNTGQAPWERKRGDKVIVAHPTVVQRLKEMTDEPRPECTYTMGDKYDDLKKSAEEQKQAKRNSDAIDWLANFPILRNPNGIIDLDIGA